MNGACRINLTDDQHAEAMTVAHERQRMNVARGIRDKYGATKGLALHEIGVMGERAVAVWRNEPWTGNLGDFKAADVGELQVRTRTEQFHKLILHPADCDQDVFVLATILSSRLVELTGWLYGRMGKHIESG